MEKQRLCKQTAGLHSEGLQALGLPSLKTKEQAWSQRPPQKPTWFTGSGISHMRSKVPERRPSVRSRRRVGQAPSFPLCPVRAQAES